MTGVSVQYETHAGYELSQCHGMRKHFRTIAISALLLVPASAARAQVSLGIRIGRPPAERAYRVPPQPGPDYLGGLPLSAGFALCLAQRLLDQAAVRGRVLGHTGTLAGDLAGQWEGSRGNLSHDHRWDRGDQRDEHRDAPPVRR